MQDRPETSAQEPPWPNAGYAWYVNVVLMLAFVLAFIDRQIISLLVGPIQADLGLSDTQISLLGGLAFVTFYTLLGVPIGRLVDRRNRVGLIAIGIFFWSLMTAVCGLARNFTQLFLARVGVGVGEATLAPAALSIIADYFPKKKLGFAVSVFLSGSSLGTGLAFILGGAAIDWVESRGELSVPVLGELAAWQFAFIVVGAPGMLFSLLMLTVKEPLRRSRMLAAGSGVGASTVPLRQAVTYLWSRKGFYLLLFIGIGLYLAFGYGLSFWAIEYFVRTFGSGRSDIAYFYGAQTIIVGAAGTMIAGMLSDRLEKRGVADAKLRVVLIGVIPMLPVSLLLAYAESERAALALIVLATFCWKFPLGAAVAALQSVTPNELRGFSTGLYLFVCNTLSIAVGPTLIALFTDFVLGDQSRLQLSIGLAGLTFLPASIIAVFFCWRNYRLSEKNF